MTIFEYALKNQCEGTSINANLIVQVPTAEWVPEEWSQRIGWPMREMHIKVDNTHWFSSLFSTCPNQPQCCTLHVLKFCVRLKWGGCRSESPFMLHYGFLLFIYSGRQAVVIWFIWFIFIRQVLFLKTVSLVCCFQPWFTLKYMHPLICKQKMC